MEDDLFDFTLAENFKMESLYKELGEELPSKKHCRRLAKKFSRSTHRIGKSDIKWEQVQAWFQDKQKKSKAKTTLSPTNIEEVDVPKDVAATTTNNPVYLKDLVSRVRKPSNKMRSPQKSKAERVAGLQELVFEAISSKDLAWYDVATFLNFRVVNSGELEARVRFAGFGYVEDEWVNVSRCVGGVFVGCFVVVVASHALAFGILSHVLNSGAKFL